MISEINKMIKQYSADKFYYFGIRALSFKNKELSLELVISHYQELFSVRLLFEEVETFTFYQETFYGKELDDKYEKLNDFKYELPFLKEVKNAEIFNKLDDMNLRSNIYPEMSIPRKFIVSVQNEYYFIQSKNVEVTLL